MSNFKNIKTPKIQINNNIFMKQDSMPTLLEQLLSQFNISLHAKMNKICNSSNSNNNNKHMPWIWKRIKISSNNNKLINKNKKIKSKRTNNNNNPSKKKIKTKMLNQINLLLMY